MSDYEKSLVGLVRAAALFRAAAKSAAESSPKIETPSDSAEAFAALSAVREHLGAAVRAAPGLRDILIVR